MLRLVGLSFACLAVAAGCSQFTVRSSFDQGASFARFHTYAWLPPDDAAPADQRVPDRLIDQQIRAAVDQELGAKGFRPATGGAADMLLNYRLTTRAGEEMNADVARFGWAWWGGSDVSSFDKGALFIGVIDAQAKHMIWVGAAEARLRPQMQISYEDRKKRIYDAVHGILEHFPPQ